MMNADRSECAQACAECAQVCLETIPVLLAKEGRPARELALLLQVTAEICRTSQTALLFGVSVHRYTCLATAAICERSAADGESLADRAMEDAIEACLDCAAYCRRMGVDTGSTALSA